jgi:hypothetical protein
MTGWFTAIALAHALDAASSCHAFQRGAYEANPVLPTQCAVVSSMQGAAAGAQIWALGSFRKEHSKKATAVLGVIVVGIEGAIVAHNIQVMTR